VGKAKNTYMKKFFFSLPRLLAVASLSFALSCNSSDQSDDNDGQGDITTNHNIKGDSSMTDTTRTATSGQGNDVTSAMSDTGFISKNIMDNMMEVQLSKVGRDKGADAQVKKIATQMVTDHTQMLNDLKAIAPKKGVSTNAGHTMDMASMPALGNASGKEFDKMWTSQMLTMHETKLAELQNFINTTTDPDLKALATKAMPKIQKHRDVLATISGATNKATQ
jgi:putative membrane protein